MSNQEGCLKQFFLFLAGLALVSVVSIVVVGMIGVAGDYFFQWSAAEHLVRNLFYIFGSWALIHGIYILALANTKRASSASRWETFKYIVSQLGLIFAVVGVIGLISGFGQLYLDKLFTLDGFIQALIVIIVPALFGIKQGLDSSRVDTRREQ